MFFSRSRSTATTQSLIGSPAANGRPALEQALAPLAKKPDDRTNVVDELVDMNIAEPTRTDFTPQVCKLVSHWPFQRKVLVVHFMYFFEIWIWELSWSVHVLKYQLYLISIYLLVSHLILG